MSLPASRAGAIKHAEKILADLAQRDDADYSAVLDATYRLQVAQVDVAKYRRLCLDHGIALKLTKQAAESIDEHGRDRTAEQERFLNEL